MITVLMLLVALLCIIGAIRSLFYVRVSRYEYLHVLNLGWKEARDVRLDMQKLKRRFIGSIAFDNDLAQLVEEGLVEREWRKEEIWGFVFEKTYFRLSRVGFVFRKN